MKRIVRIGTRGSRLAMAQTHFVKAALISAQPDLSVDIVEVKTTGDRENTHSLKSLGGTGVFVKQLEQALMDSEIDLAVHSAKDLPSTMTDGLTLAAVPVREDCEDVWVSASDTYLVDTVSGAKVGTGSPRRRALLLNRRPDLNVHDIRGNVETRLQKLKSGEYDAIVLARAGLRRLGLVTRATEVLSPDQFVPAGGQGSLAVQCRTDNDEIKAMASHINDTNASIALDTERQLLRRLDAGCSAAVGGWARVKDGRLLFSAVVLDPDGRTCLRAVGEDDPEGGKELANRVADELLEQGAVNLIVDKASGNRE